MNCPPKSFARLSVIILCVFLSALFFFIALDWAPGEANFRKVKKAFDLITGFWAISAMLFAFILMAPENCVKTDEQRNKINIHKKAGILFAVTFALHWIAASGPKWLIALGLMEPMGRRAHRAAEGLYGFFFRVFGPHITWLGIIIVVLLILALFAYPYLKNRWTMWHRLFIPATVLSSLHGVLSFPARFQFGLLHMVAILLFITSLIYAASFFRSRK